MKNDNVVLNSAGNLECLRCGELFSLGLPRDVAFVADLGHLFSRHHRKCEKEKLVPDIPPQDPEG